jgi:hypothetical protein
MTQPADNAALIDQELPEGQAPPSPEDQGPETEAEARERDIQRRLSQQGRELANARRQAEVAQAAAQASATQVAEMRTYLQQLSTNLNERDRRDQAERQKQLEAELASLPPADRLQRQIEILQGQITTIQQTRTAAPQAQPARQQAPQQAQPQRQTQATDDERRAYMEKRVQEIVLEAERTYGVRPNLDAVPDADWDSEETFTRSVMQQAQAGGNGNVAKKDETPAQMRERIRQEEREKLGVSSPAAPRAAGTGGRRKAASEADVRAAAQTYDARLGPKANIERMKKLREGMG